MSSAMVCSHLGRALNRSHCGATQNNFKLTDLNFGDDVTTARVSNEVEPLGVEVAAINTIFRIFGIYQEILLTRNILSTKTSKSHRVLYVLVV